MVKARFHITIDILYKLPTRPLPISLDPGRKKAGTTSTLKGLLNTALQHNYILVITADYTALGRTQGSHNFTHVLHFCNSTLPVIVGRQKGSIDTLISP